MNDNFANLLVSPISEAEEMAELITRGVVDQSSLECRRFSIDDINSALDEATKKASGMGSVNVVSESDVPFLINHIRKELAAAEFVRHDKCKPS